MAFLSPVIILLWVFIIAFLLETTLLPASMAMFLHGLSENSKTGFKINVVDRFFPNAAKEKSLTIEGSGNQRNFFEMLMYFPVTFALWSLYINTWYCYLILIIISVVTFILCKVSKTNFA